MAVGRPCQQACRTDSSAGVHVVPRILYWWPIDGYQQSSSKRELWVRWRYFWWNCEQRISIAPSVAPISLNWTIRAVGWPSVSVVASVITWAFGSWHALACSMEVAKCVSMGSFALCSVHVSLSLACASGSAVCLIIDLWIGLVGAENLGWTNA